MWHVTASVTSHLYQDCVDRVNLERENVYLSMTLGANVKRKDSHVEKYLANSQTIFFLNMW